MFEMFMPTPLSLQQYLLRAAAILLVVGIHGLLLAVAARLLGDRGPSHAGRFTLNPLVHLDLIGAIAAILYRPGWMRPMRIDHEELRLGRFGLILCALIACGGTVFLGIAAQFLKPLIATLVAGNVGLTIQSIITTFGRISLWFGLVNLLPLTPLTGGHILAAVSPAAGKLLEKHLLWPTIAVALLIASGLAERIVAPAYALLAPLGVGL